MNNFGVDLEHMVLERVSGESLKEVARVNRGYREYIGNNPHRMRLIACKELNIHVYERVSSMAEVFAGGRSNNGGLRSHYQYGLNNCVYLPTDKLTFWTLRDTSSQGIVDRLVNYLPEWWIRQVGKIHCYIDEALFCCFVSKLRHVSELAFDPDPSRSSEETIAATIGVITTSLQVDRFWFKTLNGIDQTVFQAIVAKSKNYPTEFPIICPRIRIYFKTFLYFMENAVFTDIKEHEFKITIGGYLREWDSWVSAYTIEPLLPVSERDWEFSLYKFQYRGMKFHAEIRLMGTSHTDLFIYV